MVKEIKSVKLNWETTQWKYWYIGLMHYSDVGHLNKEYGY